MFDTSRARCLITLIEREKKVFVVRDEAPHFLRGPSLLSLLTNPALPTSESLSPSASPLCYLFLVFSCIFIFLSQERDQSAV